MRHGFAVAVHDTLIVLAFCCCKVFCVQMVLHKDSLSGTATASDTSVAPCDAKSLLCSTSRTWRPSENYLVQFTGVQLGDPELLKIWEAYELGGDGRMDREELSFLMEDLCEVIRHIDNDGGRATERVIRI